MKIQATSLCAHLEQVVKVKTCSNIDEGDIKNLDPLCGERMQPSPASGSHLHTFSASESVKPE